MSGAPGTGGSNAGFAFKPRSVPTRPNNATTAPAPQYSFPSTYGSGRYDQQAYYSQQTPSHYGQQAAPQIRNPFPLPGQGGHGSFQDRQDNLHFDADEQAQIAQWQSQYLPKEDVTRNKLAGSGSGNPNLVALGTRLNASAPAVQKGESSSARAEDTPSTNAVPKETVMRNGGGKTWEDSSLLEWDPAHFRLFVGNLAGEVTDQALRQGFSRYPSLVKTKVIREKRTTKSKGFGFVSFSDGNEYFRAFKEMNGKYIGSHPIILKKSTTPIQAVSAPNKDKKNGKDQKKDTTKNANTGAGVQKKPAKTKGGLKILG